MREPVRRHRISTRSYRGRVVRDGGSNEFESALERDFLCLLDFDRSVLEVCEQPLTIQYTERGRQRAYTPDFLVDFESGVTLLVEVKFREDMAKHWRVLRPGFKAAVSYCREMGWRFKIMTEVEIRGTFLDNACFLRGYLRHPPDEALEEQVVRSLAALGRTTPRVLMQAAFESRHYQMRALAALWRLVAIRRVSASLDKPISLETPVWVNVGEGFGALGP